MRIALAKRWQGIAKERADWAEYLVPELKDDIRKDEEA